MIPFSPRNSLYYYNYLTFSLQNITLFFTLSQDEEITSSAQIDTFLALPNILPTDVSQVSILDIAHFLYLYKWGFVYLKLENTPN